MAGFVAGNVLDGLVAFAPWDVAEKEPETVLLDVREDAELMFVIIFILPALLIIFSKLIEKTSYHWLTPNAALAEDIAEASDEQG